MKQLIKAAIMGVLFLPFLPFIGLGLLAVILGNEILYYLDIWMNRKT